MMLLISGTCDVNEIGRIAVKVPVLVTLEITHIIDKLINYLCSFCKNKIFRVFSTHEPFLEVNLLKLTDTTNIYTLPMLPQVCIMWEYNQILVTPHFLVCSSKAVHLKYKR